MDISKSFKYRTDERNYQMKLLSSGDFKIVHMNGDPVNDVEVAHFVYRRLSSYRFSERIHFGEDDHILTPIWSTPLSDLEDYEGIVAPADHDFTGEDADFRLRSFENAYLRSASFHGMNLQRALFQNTNLRYVNFNKASLVGAEFNSVPMKGMVARGADFFSSEWEGITSCKVGCRDASFRHATFQDVTLSGSDFSGSDFSSTYFDRCTFNRVEFDGADFSEAEVNATFNDCSFLDATFSKAMLEKTTFIKCRFSPRAQLGGASTINCTFN